MPLPFIILASQSPRRKQLLEWAEVPFEIVVRHSNEDFPEDLPIEQVPIFIARNKAIAVKDYCIENDIPIQPVLAADTIVVLDNKVIGKPKDREDAIAILTALSGKKHQVITGVSILSENDDIAFADITDVYFHPITQEQIEFYVDNYKPYDKAGAYAIQEWIGVVGIKSVNGDFYNVMGLPVSRVVQELEKL
ncbi:Maf family nucleotide pyrophosphatase [Danxiaibacter flavus]|uniref:dTTP/UTP pyrophosphatase n=1 Tax=Danxiaibacter flavus TaxID=3049108 RepID=A0ABV3ZCX8_9BACT|nr:Maf family nucleotide pyrophosphatase [Chitinophagaceae bacterium DXS]